MAGLPSDFVILLNAYKDNLASYRVTGNTAYQTAYQNALNGLNQKLAEVEAGVQRDSSYVQNVITQYADANPKLTSLHQKAQVIKQVGPKLQDEYIQTKQLNTPAIQPVDHTPLYIKGGVIIALLAIAGFAAAR
jgi:CHASE3 domain sensor protein